MSKDLSFICFLLLFVLFIQINHTCVMSCISVNAIFEPCIVIQYRKDGNVFNLRKNILSRNKQNIDFSTLFYQCIVTAFRVYCIIKYLYLLFLIDSIAFTFYERPNLHLVSLFYKSFILSTIFSQKN